MEFQHIFGPWPPYSQVFKQQRFYELRMSAPCPMTNSQPGGSLCSVLHSKPVQHKGPTGSSAATRKATATPQPSFLRKIPKPNMFTMVGTYTATPTPPHPFLKHALEKNSHLILM